MSKVFYSAVLVFLATGVCCWQDLAVEDSKEKSLEDYDCSVDGQCENDLNGNEVMKRKGTGFSTIFSGKSGVLPYLHSGQSLGCSCEAHFRLKDLGHAYHPRFLPSAVCETDTCTGAYRCRQKHYKVKVLRRKDAGPPQEANTALLPESLRNTWAFETVVVTVGCECGP